MTGIPCNHAISCMVYKNIDPAQFVNDLYKISTYKKIYEPWIAPMSSANMWEGNDNSQSPELLPPNMIKMPGRPKKLRKRSREEFKAGSGKIGKKFQNSLRCRVCWQYGHNSRFHKKGAREAEGGREAGGEREEASNHLEREEAREQQPRNERQEERRDDEGGEREREEEIEINITQPIDDDVSDQEQLNVSHSYLFFYF